MPRLEFIVLGRGILKPLRRIYGSLSSFNKGCGISPWPRNPPSRSCGRPSSDIFILLSGAFSLVISFLSTTAAVKGRWGENKSTYWSRRTFSTKGRSQAMHVGILTRPIRELPATSTYLNALLGSVDSLKALSYLIVFRHTKHKSRAELLQKSIPRLRSNDAGFPSAHSLDGCNHI